MRAQFYYNYGQNATHTPFFGANINNDRGPVQPERRAGTGWSDFTMRTRAVITVDTREQTDYGVLRTYFLIGHTGDSPNPEGLYANRGFIQFAGFTFGLAQSFFDFYSAPAMSYFATNTEDTGDGGWRVAAFTANFGNGITSTLSLEEPRRLGVVNAAFAGQVTGSFNPNGPNIRTQFNNPFLVGAVVPQRPPATSRPRTSSTTRASTSNGAPSCWAAPSPTSTAPTTAPMPPAPRTGLTSCAPPGFNAVTDATTGTAVARRRQPGVGAVHAGIPPTSSDGWPPAGCASTCPAAATSRCRAATPKARCATSATPSGRPAAPPGSGSATRWASAGSWTASIGQSGELELTRAWGIYASWEQVWNPKWKTSIYGGWTSVSYNDNAKALIAAATCGNQTGSSGNVAARRLHQRTATRQLPTPGVGLDHQRDQLRSQLADGLRRHPHPVEHHLAVLHGRGCPLHQALHRLLRARRLPLSGPGPGSDRPAVYSIENQDNWAVTFRVHRDFVL